MVLGHSMKMVSTLFLVFSIFLFSRVENVFCGVPVLMWESSPTTEKSEIIPALSQLDSDGFSNHIIKKVHVHKPLIVVFLEETLSIEDFSWKDSDHKGSFPKLQNITGMSSKVEFIPWVYDPVSAIKDLISSHGYYLKKYDKTNLPTKSGIILEVKLGDPLNNEDRPDLLRRHDGDIAEIYSQLLAKHSRIFAIFTGKQSSWVELEANRVKRELKKNKTTTETSNGDSKYKFVFDTPFAKIASINAPVLKVKFEEGTDYKSFSLPANATLSHDDRPFGDSSRAIKMIISFPIKVDSVPEIARVSLRFRINTITGPLSSWMIDRVEVKLKGKQEELFPLQPLNAKLNRSFEGTNVQFGKKNIILTFKDIRAELFRESKKGISSFSKVEDKGIPLISAGVCSGLIVSTIFIIMLSIGFLMLIDIKTMDRFDDPKGKTIQITTYEN